MTRRSRVRMDAGPATGGGTTETAVGDRQRVAIGAQSSRLSPRNTQNADTDEEEGAFSGSERENAPANANTTRQQRRTRTRTRSSTKRSDDDAAGRLLLRERAENIRSRRASACFQGSERSDADLTCEERDAVEPEARVEDDRRRQTRADYAEDTTSDKLETLRVDLSLTEPVLSLNSGSGHNGLRRGTNGEGPFLGVKLPTYGKRRRARGAAAARASMALLCTRKSSSPDSVHGRADEEQGATEPCEERDARNERAILAQDPAEASMWKCQRQFWDCVDNVILEEELDDGDLKGLLH
jgi:multidrug efflux pump subunit AcrA (membrane-fusion protein)